jgi:DNA-binding transcriptional ArsR family regulator
VARALISRHWTPEDDAELIALVRQGKSFVAIAARLRRTKSAIKHRAKIIMGDDVPGAAHEAGPQRRADRP